MGSPWKHRLLSKDPITMTGVCASCGPIALRWQTSRGTRSPLCKGGYDEHMRKVKNRHAYVHGITPAVYEEMLSLQGDVCAICKRPSSEILQIDHDHVTGDIRGLLCRACNCGMGFFQDSAEVLEEAIAYLKRKRAAPHEAERPVDRSRLS